MTPILAVVPNSAIQSTYSSSTANKQQSWFSTITFSKQDLLPSLVPSSTHSDQISAFERQKVQTAITSLISVVTLLRHVTKSSPLKSDANIAMNKASIPKDIQIPVTKSLTACFCKTVDLLRLLSNASVNNNTHGNNVGLNGYVTEQEIANKLMMEGLIQSLHTVADNAISTFYNLLLAFDDRTKTDFVTNNTGLKLVLQQSEYLPMESFSKLVAQWICEKMNVK